MLCTLAPSNQPSAHCSANLTCMPLPQARLVLLWCHALQWKTE
jgi:hypothetical protein